MIGNNLQTHEQGCHYNAPGIFTSIAQGHTANGGWNKGQGKDLPYMTCSNDNEKVTGKCPYHGS